MEDANAPAPAQAPDAAAPEHSPQVYQLCSRLFRWTCANCTCPNPLLPPTPDMLAYCAALSARMAAQSELAQARARHTAATYAHLERVSAWARARAAAGGGGADAWESARATVTVTASGPGGSATSSASAAATSAAAAPLGPRPEPPPQPDFAAMLQALPSVPPPPSVPPALLAQQACEDCEAPVLHASPSVNLPSGALAAPSDAPALARAMGANLDLLTATLMHSSEVEGGAEEAEGSSSGGGSQGGEDAGTELDDGGEEAEARAAAAAPAEEEGVTLALARVHVRRSVASYLADCGVTGEGVEAALAGALAGCGAGCTSTAHAHLHPLAPAASASGSAAASRSGGGGGSGTAAALAAVSAPAPARRPPPPAAPVLVVAFDQRMLLHEARADRSASIRLPSEWASGGGGGGGAVALPPPPLRPHPERPDRLRAIAQHLFAQGLLQRCVLLPPRLARAGELATVHTEGHCRMHLQQLPAHFAEAGAAAAAAAGAAAGAAAEHAAAAAAGGDAGAATAAASAAAEAASAAAAAAAAATHHMFDSDTYANIYTGEAALLAAGGVLACVEAVVKGRADRGLALVRPPGHHADADKSQGFCIYNNVAVAAAVARKEWGVRRVLILDWDVHHGNGACVCVFAHCVLRWTHCAVPCALTLFSSAPSHTHTHTTTPHLSLLRRHGEHVLRGPLCALRLAAPLRGGGVLPGHGAPRAHGRGPGRGLQCEHWLGGRGRGGRRVPGSL